MIDEEITKVYLQYMTHSATDDGWELFDLLPHRIQSRLRESLSNRNNTAIFDIYKTMGEDTVLRLLDFLDEKERRKYYKNKEYI